MKTAIAGWYREDEEVYNVWMVPYQSKDNCIYFDPRVPADLVKPMEGVQFLGSIAPEHKQAFVELVKQREYIVTEQIEFFFHTFIASCT